AAHAASGREDLHVLGLLPEPLAAQRRVAHRPPAAQRRPRAAPARGGRGSLGARPERRERPCADVGRTGHGDAGEEAREEDTREENREKDSEESRAALSAPR